MKYKILLFGLVAVILTGCSSTYQASQTPDDVYYSPAREGIAKKERKQDRYEDYVSSQEDQYLRMKVRDRQRWSGIDDYTYWNDSRYIPSYNYDYYRNSYYSPYAWNNWRSPYYNPYFSVGYNNWSPFYYSPYGYNRYNNGYNNVYIQKYPTRPNVNTSRPNLNGYTNRSYNNTNTNRDNLGNTLKRVFTPTESYSNSNRNSGNNNTYSAPERTYSPSSSGSSSSGSSSSSGGSRAPRPSRN
jgi:hypothetical protein